MNTPKISIIANFYKSEKYIPKLINSVLCQSFQDWELVAVNDCSPGNDLMLLKKFAALPEMKGRMRIIDNKVNQGISQAKQTGIKESVGEFLTFIDGDDWFEPHALDNLYDAVRRDSEIDYVIANCYRNFFSYKSILSSAGVEYGTIYNNIPPNNSLIKGYFGINVFSTDAYWGKLFRRAIIEKSCYSPRTVQLYEDVFFNLYYFLVARKVTFIDVPIYNWRWGGISSGSEKKTESSFSANGTLHNFNDFYFERLKIIEDYNLKDVLEPLRIELYNILRCSLGSICSYKPDSLKSGEVKSVIEEAISLPAYKEILKLRGNAYIQNPAFFDALEKHDLDWLYNFFHQIYKANWKRRTLHRVFSLF